VLDALVAARFLRPLQRDNGGTLWRVYLPREAFGEPLGDDVLLGRPALPAPGNDEVEPDARPARRAAPVVRISSLSPRSGGRVGEGDGSAAMAGPADPLTGLARRLAAARGAPESVVEAEAELADLIADGASPRQLEASIRALEARAEHAAARRSAR
jgi:hypothetical protein